MLLLEMQQTPGGSSVKVLGVPQGGSGLTLPVLQLLPHQPPVLGLVSGPDVVQTGTTAVILREDPQESGVYVRNQILQGLGLLHDLFLQLPAVLLTFEGTAEHVLPFHQQHKLETTM